MPSEYPAAEVKKPSPPFRGDTIDVGFAAPQTHRLRFTDDVLGSDRDALVDLLRVGARSCRVLACVDSGVADANERLDAALRESIELSGAEFVGEAVIVPGGEACKNDPVVVERLLRRIDSEGLDRQSFVIAIGGGAVLDAVGFAAATAHRGIRLIRLPTTTLGQTDSGVGVKSAVNRFGKKNWQGCFATPWAVINDRRLLESLPDRDFRAGFSEAVKVALLKSQSFFDQIRNGAADIRRRSWPQCGPVVRESALWHLDHIVHGGDPFEVSAARPLDFGHWSAHRLETLSGFEIRHGEAVAIGLAIDATYSSLKHGLDGVERAAVLQTLADLGLPLSHPLVGDAAALLEGLEEFRQHLGGELTVTMLSGIGRPLDTHRIDHGAMREAIATVAAVDEASGERDSDAA